MVVEQISPQGVILGALALIGAAAAVAAMLLSARRDAARIRVRVRDRRPPRR